MMGKKDRHNLLFETIDLERLLQVLDYGFIREEVAQFYHLHIGRPSIDPEVTFRMLVLSFMFNLSDVRLISEVSLHAGYRWFCHLNFSDPVPDRTTLVKARKLWNQGGVFQKVMERVVRICEEAGLIGNLVAIDGTQMNANAAISSLQRIDEEPSHHDEEPPDPPSPQTGGSEHDAQTGERAQQNVAKEAGRLGNDFRGQKLRNHTHRSVTDPHSRLYRKAKGKETKLSFIVHNAVDCQTGVIVGTTVTMATGNAEREAAYGLLRHCRRLLGKRIEEAVMDAGYREPDFMQKVEEMGIVPYVSMRGMKAAPVPTWQKGIDDPEVLAKRQVRLRRVHARNRAVERTQTERYLEVKKQRMKVEHRFAEGKGRHGLGRARYRRLERVRAQAFMTAVVQNLKRLMSRAGTGPKPGSRLGGSPLVLAIFPGFFRPYDRRRKLRGALFT